MESYNKFIVYNQNIIHNFNEIKKHTQSKICLMVKANAYGYGVVNIVKLLDGEVDYFGVANSREAIEISQYVKNAKVLVCGIPIESSLKTLVENKISFACPNLDYLKKVPGGANIHIMVNTGMNRLGTKNLEEIKKMVTYCKNNNIIIEGIFTHSGFSELNNKSKLQSQYTRFRNLLKNLQLPKTTLAHFANSGSFCYSSLYHLDMVRLGKILYGVNPLNTKNKLNLLPIFKLESKIIQKQRVLSGEYIGYGELKTDKDIIVGIIPIGYADGFLTNYTGCSVIIKNKKYKIISICMDLAIIEIDDTISVNDKVLVMGIDDKNKIEVNDYGINNYGEVASQVVANLNKKRFDTIIKN